VSLSANSFTHLPVHTLLPELQKSLERSHAVLSSPTGSGKTTCVPLILHQARWLKKKKIIMLEPRRIGARAAASRMSSLLRESVGSTVGYRTRFDTKVSKKTSIEVITEGILIRQLQNSPELTDIGLIIFDEFHERSILTDLCLALCLDLCELRDDLRLLVMSATVETKPISRLLGNARVFKGGGRSYPVTIQHLVPINKQPSLSHQVVWGILHAWEQDEGDILAFLPGAHEIHKCKSLLAKRLVDALILPLFGNLNHAEQDRVFQKENRRRRIILATPIAETSITIENVSCIVDSGYYRRPVYDHVSGLSRLTTLQVSHASAAQRAGRAGRLGPGKCYRLWDQNVNHNMLDHTPPEILHGDLGPLVLELALWGVVDPTQLAWLDLPRPSTWKIATRLLQQLNLLNSRSNITDLGRQVAVLPIHPRLGLMLVTGEALGLGWTSCLLAATLSERDLLRKVTSSVDIYERIKTLEKYDNDRTQLPDYLDGQLCRRLLQMADQWYRLLGRSKKKEIDYSELGNLLSYAFPDRIALLRPGSNHQYILASGRAIQLPPGDLLAGNTMLVTPQVDAGKKSGKIFIAASITTDELKKDHSHLFTERRNVRWSTTNERVLTSNDLMLGKLKIDSRPLTSVDPFKITKIFLQGIGKSGTKCLPWSRKARDLQARICSLHFWQPSKWPDLSDKQLFENLDWLAPYCLQMNRLDQLQKLDMKNILLALIPWNQQQQLNTLAPSHLQVPSGSSIRLLYNPGEPPVLAVRLQELFGLTDTPSICQNRIPVILHLLSPASRPVQITSDLQSFWKNSYPQVKKELAGRYPKHYWPDNPLQAAATSRTKKR